MIFKILYCANSFLIKLTQENYKRKEIFKKGRNSIFNNILENTIIIPIISNDFSEDMINYINLIELTKNNVNDFNNNLNFIKKPKILGKYKSQDIPTENNIGIRTKKSLITEKLINNTTISAIYDKFLTHKLYIRNNSNEKGLNKINVYNLCNNNQSNLNRKIDKKIVKSISKFTNELVSNKNILNFHNSKFSFRGHTSQTLKQEKYIFNSLIIDKEPRIKNHSNRGSNYLNKI